MPELLPVVAVAGLGWALWSHHFGSGREARERQETLAAQRPMRARAKGWCYDDTVEGDIRYRLHGMSPGGRSAAHVACSESRDTTRPGSAAG